MSMKHSRAIKSQTLCCPKPRDFSVRTMELGESIQTIQVGQYGPILFQFLRPLAGKPVKLSARRLREQVTPSLFVQFALLPPYN